MASQRNRYLLNLIRQESDVISIQFWYDLCLKTQIRYTDVMVYRHTEIQSTMYCTSYHTVTGVKVGPMA